MSTMFCFQCEQTAGGKGCAGKAGVCGKPADVAVKQDVLTAALIGLARAAEGKTPDAATDDLVMQGLFATITNVNFDGARIDALTREVRAAAARLGTAAEPAPETLFHGEANTVSLRSLVLFGMRGIAAYAWHARVLGVTDPTVNAFFYKGLREIMREHALPEWLALVKECGLVNLDCMAALDKANTQTYGHPAPATVSTTREKGPFIVVTGHDLLDLKQLLDQTAGKGIHIYTHGEMLPAHGYPELRKYPHLKGNYGTAWQNQQKEFADLPGAVLYTTNCLMPPKAYGDRLFTTAVVGFPGVPHIPEGQNGVKDFTPVIQKALALGGWTETTPGKPLSTGFGHQTVMSVAGTVIDAVKSGALKHIFLVGGCDGAKPGRNYYTEFAEKAPANTIILTLACGKYRINHLDLGTLGGLPRLLDMGQCNDAYSAITVAVALAKAFNCTVNDLPLSLILSWYEQKAVCILLTLLALGVKNIRLGPSLPAFVSPAVLDVLVKEYGIKPITTPEADLKAILG
ncbi:MAG: hydroxylamine reductase [Lentisphaerae bacterium]|nr:hydroxylamine reductase [Lentisphaerota bacterium]